MEPTVSLDKLLFIAVPLRQLLTQPSLQSNVKVTNFKLFSLLIVLKKAGYIAITSGTASSSPIATASGSLVVIKAKYNNIAK